MLFPLLLDPFPTLLFLVNACVTSSRKPSFMHPRVCPIVSDQFPACLHHSRSYAVFATILLWTVGSYRPKETTSSPLYAQCLQSVLHRVGT